MLTFTSNKTPFAVHMHVVLPLRCSERFFNCVEFVATVCANGTYVIEITDADVLDYIDTNEAQFRALVIEEHDILATQQYTYTPPTP